MSILPTIITMSDLQRCAKQKLQGITDIAIIRRHNEDIAFVLHPTLGRLLLESGLLDVLKKKTGVVASVPDQQPSSAAPVDVMLELDKTIGQILRELSKR